MTPQSLPPRTRRRASATTRWSGTACSVVVLCATLVHAQPAPERGYVLGGIAFHRQDGPTGEVGETYVTAPGGWTTGWTLGAGIHVTGRVSVEGEVAATGVMKAREPSRYDITYNEERRDTFFGVNLRGRVTPASRVQLEPVVGAAIVRHQGWSRNEYARYTGTLPVTVTYDPRLSKDLPMSLGLSAGLDARIGGSRVSLMPSFRIRRRVRRVNGENEFDWWYPGGMATMTISTGAMLRVAF